jgi:hypothetical protein
MATAIRLWTVAVVAYAAATLMWLDWKAASDTAVQPMPGSHAADADPSTLNTFRTLAAIAGAHPAEASVFDIPFRIETLEQTGQYRFALLPAPGAQACSVQVIAESDNRFSFSHVFDNVALDRDVFTFHAPLTGGVARAFWQPVGHAGQWSDWERSGLRRLQVKVFAKSPIAAGLKLCYRSVAATPSAGGRLAWSQVLAAPVPLGGRFELAFDLEDWNGNPFDYTALQTVLEVTPADAAPLRIRPFHHQNFEAVDTPAGESFRPCGPKHFLARYRPRATGPHAYRLLTRDADGAERVLDHGSFDVTAGTPPDFLRVSPRSPRFFEHADGRFFYPIGWNIPYPMDRPYGQDYVPYLPDTQSLAFMHKMLDDLADSGGTFIRFWLSDWWNGLEWNASVDTYGGIGRYNLKNAWINDRIVEQCERRGIRLQWEMLNHTRLKWDYGWPQHPYHVGNGGFLRDAREFWSHPRTQTLSNNRLTYIVARYADSPAIHSMAIMSEPDMVGGASQWPGAKPYILSQLRFLRQADPYGHISVNQMCLPDSDPSFFREPEVEFVSANAYSGGIAGFADDQIPAIRDFSEFYRGHGRPMLVAECAGHYAGDPDFKMRRDTLGALWSGVASGLAGTPLSWWWNVNYGEDLGGWYRVVADFMRDEDLIAGDAPARGGWRSREVVCASRAGNLRALMAGNDTRRFLFVYNYDTLSRTRGVPSSCADNRVQFAGLAPGAYVAEYWDLQRGRTPLVQVFDAGEGGAAEIAPPAFNDGWAIKIRPRAEASPSPGQPPVALPAPAVPAAAGRAADWSWRILPQADVAVPSAAGRAVLDVRIGLPESCRGRGPRVTDAGGQPVSFTWAPLGDGAGWRIVVPAVHAQPLMVTAGDGAEPTAGQPPPDDTARGLSVTVARIRAAPIPTVARFQEQFAALSERRQASVAVIDQVENPLGPSDHFLAVYQGPLLAPEDGEYVFAANSDDGCFVTIDGQTVIAWPGGHDMEVPNRPAANLWQRRGRVTLKRGLHEVAFYHQQGGGACLARLGWRPPPPARPDSPLIAPPFSSPSAPAFAVVPEWALDGRIPCVVEVRHQGVTRAALAPALGLELRRPRTPIAVAAWTRDGRRHTEFFAGEGLRTLISDGLAFPVWAWNPARIPFSLEWNVRTTGPHPPALKTLLYDAEMPLTVQIGADRGQPPAERLHSPRRWVEWPLAVRDQGAPFRVRLGPVLLLEASLGRWDAVPDEPPPKRQTPPLTRLIEAGPVPPLLPLAGRRLAPWWRGAPPETVMPGFLRLDPWSGDAAPFDAALGDLEPGTGVLVRLDRRVARLGLSREQATRRLDAFMRAVRLAGGEPVLVLDPGIEIVSPPTQALALVLNRLGFAFGCPFIDLREPAP